MNAGPLVSTSWLADHLDDPTLRIVDASWYLPDHHRDPKAEYLAAHIPGAVPFDIDAVTAPGSPYPHTIPSPQIFAAAVTALGIGSEHYVVAYDGLGFFSSPRVWWMFRLFGHDRVAVLDGGFPKWQSESLPEEAGAKPPAPAVPPFAPDFRPHMVRTTDQVRDNIESGEELVLDARGPGRFAGTDPEPRAGVRSGHIPGSRNLHYPRLSNDQDGTFHGPEALAEVYRSVAVTPDRPTVCSCGSGVTACIVALGLHMIGNHNVAVYDGSWSEWGQRTDTPIETGPDGAD